MVPISWTTPRTWVAGEIVTAAIGNTHWRDNLSFLYNGRPYARAYSSVNLAAASGSYTILAFNSEAYDTDTMHDTVSFNTRLTAKTAGLYVITATVEFAASAAGNQRNLRIFLNSASVVAEQATSPIGGGVPKLSVAAELFMVVNDYVEASVYQDSGGSLNVTAVSALSPSLSAVMVS